MTHSATKLALNIKLWGKELGFADLALPIPIYLSMKRLILTGLITAIMAKWRTWNVTEPSVPDPQSLNPVP